MYTKPGVTVIMSSSTIILQNSSPESAHSGTSENTWVDQSGKNERIPKRLDKFVCTGGMQTLPLAEIQERIGNVARLGFEIDSAYLPKQLRSIRKASESYRS